MKRILFFALVAFSLQTFAQNTPCVPDAMNQDSLFGLWPDTTQNLPTAVEGVYYESYVQLKTPDDFIIATGKTYSIKEFINKATKYLNMEVKWVGKGLKEKLVYKKNNKTIIKINPKFFRPAEVNTLTGNANKAKKKLNWEPKTNLNQLIKIMIDDELRYYNDL